MVTYTGTKRKTFKKEGTSYVWVLNETVISAGLITTGKIKADVIDIDELFAQTITATDLHVKNGYVGDFEINSSLTGRNGNNTIVLDPKIPSIVLTNSDERTVTLKTGALSSIDSLIGNNYKFYNTSYPSSFYINIASLLPSTLRSNATNFQSIAYYNKYVNPVAGGAYATIINAIPATYFSLPATVNTKYTVVTPVHILQKHSLQKGDSGKYHKRRGTIKYEVRVCIKNNAGNIVSDGYSIRYDEIFINQEGIDTIDLYSVHRQQLTVPAGGGNFYVHVEVKLAGDIQYQVWNNPTFGSSYWSTSDGVGKTLEFNLAIDRDFAINAAQGKTELTTNGFQSVWTENTYFRIDGDNAGVGFIQSKGSWRHNGYEVLVDKSGTLSGEFNPGDYVLGSYLSQNYTTTINSDAKYAKKAGDSTQEFTVKDLIIHGTVNHWLGDTITVEDANLQLNRRQSGATVASGIVIFNKDTSTEVSKLQYNVDGVWNIDGNRIPTIDVNPLNNGIAHWDTASSKFIARASAADSDKLGGVVAASYYHSGNSNKNTVNWTADSLYARYFRLCNTVNGDGAIFAKFLNYEGNPFGLHLMAYSNGAVGVQNRREQNSGENFNIIFNPLGGNVGIGNTTPAEKLDVVGNIKTNGNFQTSGVNGQGLRFWDSADGYRIHMSQTSDATWGGQVSGAGASDYNMYFRMTGGTNRGFVWLNYRTPIMQLEANGNLTAIGNIKAIGKGLFGSDLETTAVQFTTGFAGQGWKLDAATNHLTVDKLTVRSRMDVYELVINQIRATNGSFWISDSVKVVSNQLVDSNVRYRLFINKDTNNTLVVNDIVKAQQFDGRNVRVFIGRVQRIDNIPSNEYAQFIPVVLPLEGTPWDGMDLVRIGNTDANSSRQGTMYLTSSDDGAPYMDVLDGVNTHIHTTPRNIRYIRDWLNGSSANGGNHWVEIKALNSAGVNIAQGKAVTGLNGSNPQFPLSRVTDDNIDAASYGEQTVVGGLQWVQVDLGSIQEIDKVQVWHYYGDGRTYNKTKTEVSTDGVVWYPIFDSAVQGTYPETAAGRAYTLGASKTRLRVGKLSGISGQSGYGIWGSQNGVDTDFVISSAGYASIAGFKFDKQKLEKQVGGVFARMGELFYTGQFGFGVGSNDANCIKMFIDGNNLGKIEGKKDGVAHFVLTDTGVNRIANWNFDKDRLWWETPTADRGISIGGIGAPGIHVYMLDAGNVYSNISIGNILRHGNAWTNGFGINAWFNNQTYFEVSKHLTTGVITAKLAGCNFDASSVWAGNPDKTKASWRLNADGSGYLGGGKFTFDGNGNATLDKTLTAQTLIGEVLQSTNWISTNGTAGVKFNLFDGELLFGNSIVIDAESGLINVKNKDTLVTGVKIGDFDLTPTSSSGTSISVDVSGAPYVITDNAGTFSGLEGTVSSTGYISLSTNSVLSSSFIVNGIYYISTALKFTFTREARIGTLQMLDSSKSGPYFYTNLTLKMEIIDANNVVLKTKTMVVNRTYYSNSFDEGLAIADTVKATTTSLRLKFTVTGGTNYRYYRQGEIDEFGQVRVYGDRYTIRGTVAKYNTTQKLIVKPNTSVTEISAKGFQSIWGVDKYFKIFDNPQSTTDPFIDSSGNFKHKGRFNVTGKVLTYNDWIFKSQSAGTYTIPVGESLKFEINNTSSSLLYVYLPTLAELRTMIGTNGTEPFMFDVTIKASRSMTSKFTVVPGAGVSIYNANGSDISYHDMSQGDSTRFYFDGNAWNLLTYQA